MKKIAIIFTCHNRKEKTLVCLSSIKANLSTLDPDYHVSVFICDDGSTDGTREALVAYRELPISIIDGDGNLFWAKGMAKAMIVAETSNPDFYLFINDDVLFSPNMLSIMLKTFFDNKDRLSAVVGCTQYHDCELCSYGGYDWDNNGFLFKNNFRRVQPDDDIRECKLANWNCFLLPKELYSIIGKIDDYYEHSFADYDYSNRIIRAGYHMVITDKYIGRCDRNTIKGTFLDNSLSLKTRFFLIHKRTARPPRSSWHYATKFYGLFAPLFFLQPYFYVLITSLPVFKNLRKRIA